MLFADDLVIIDEDPKRQELMLEKWRKALEGNGLKISRDITTFLTTAENSHIIKLGGRSIPDNKEFKYMGSTVDQKCETSVDVKQKSPKWMENWRKLTGVLGDNNIPIKLKSQKYATVIRTSVVYGSEGWQ